MKKILLLIALAGIVAGIILAIPKEEETKEEPVKDTGMDRIETENFMREIGYVQ